MSRRAIARLAGCSPDTVRPVAVEMALATDRTEEKVTGQGVTSVAGKGASPLVMDLAASAHGDRPALSWQCPFCYWRQQQGEVAHCEQCGWPRSRPPTGLA